MGKVLNTFTNGFAGAISRAVDDVVISSVNQNVSAPMPFGIPVALSASKTGVVTFDASTHTAAQFVGITTRIGVKTPSAYGENEGQYEVNEIVSVITRGSVVVAMEGDAIAPGDEVYINSAGKFTNASASGSIKIPAHVVEPVDANGMVEIVLNTRNLV